MCDINVAAMGACVHVVHKHVCLQVSVFLSIYSPQELLTSPTASWKKKKKTRHVSRGTLNLTMEGDG